MQSRAWHYLSRYKAEIKTNLERENTMKLMRYDTSLLGSDTELRDEMSRLFDFAFPALSRVTHPYLGQSVNPAIDLYEEKDNFILRAELPGMTKEEIALEIMDDTLTLSGERKFAPEKKGDEAVRKEISQGPFTRSIALPKSVQADKVGARYENGILTVTLPKKEEAKPKQITIEVK
jgi:HSP20 family protein